MRKPSPIRFDAKTVAFKVSPEADARIAAAIARLNPEQAEAVAINDGPAQVEAGAGTGKTGVLTVRIARLIAQHHAVPERILAVTFTNKASNEMRERLEALIGPEAAGEVAMGSFHAVNLPILRQHAEEAGLRNDKFVIYDDDDQLLAIQSAMEAVGIDDSWRRPGSSRRDKSPEWRDYAKRMLDQIQEWKDEGLLVKDAETLAAKDEASIEERKIVDVYRAYQAELDRRNAVDFADIILRVVALFRRSPAVRRHWATRFSYILVDEFQDTDTVQYEWLKIIGGTCRNVFVVGDPDQSIYEWRNAKPAIFAGFAQDWSPCARIRLHRNYRSTQQILDLSSNLVETDAARPKKSRLQSGRDGTAVSLASYDTHIDEANGVADDIHRRIAFGEDASGIAILFRQSKDMPAFEQALAARALPYAVVSGVKFHKRDEVKDILAWIAVSIDATNEIALIRTAARPASGIDDGSLMRAIVAMRNGKETVEALRSTAALDPYATTMSRDGMAKLADAIEKVSEPPASVGGLIRTILKETAYVAWRRRANLAEDDLDDVMEALALQGDEWDGSAPEFLQSFQLASEADAPEGEGCVRLSTIHAAKGLEFAVVYTPCLEEGIIPNDRSLKHQRFIREERRILHVAWTRAKAELIPSFARSRRYKPTSHSRFLEAVGLAAVSERKAADRSVNRYAAKTMIKPIRLKPAGR